VERGKLLEVLAHVVLLELLNERYDSLIVSGLRWEFDALRVEPVATDSAEVFVVCDVEEVDVLLYSSAQLWLEQHPYAYTTKLPFAFFCHQPGLAGRQLDEIFIRLYKGLLRALENNLRVFGVRSTCDKCRRTQRE
jgi:hypothetical protein